MAGDWLKIRHDLDDDPHVMRMQEILGITDVDVLIAKLRRLWRYADIHTTDGFIPFATAESLNRITRLNGLAKALVEVGWLDIDDCGAKIVRFSDHNGASAKRRAIDQKRKRDKRADCPQNVHTFADEKRTREEKRREEKNLGDESPKNPSCSEPLFQAASEPAGAVTDKPLESHHPTTGVNPRSGSPQDRGGLGQSPDQAVRVDPAGDPVVMLFPVVGGKRQGSLPEWPLLQSKVEEYSQSFPGVDILAECRKALQWCRDNAVKRKTARGMPIFLFRWLAKCQNRFGPEAPGRGPPQLFSGAQRYLDSKRSLP